MMKAVVMHKFGDPEVLQVEDVPLPTIGPGDVLIRVRAAGINPLDTYIRSGQSTFLPSLPTILGKDVAGTVEQVGCNVTKFKKGDRVFASLLETNGGYAEYAACSEDNVMPLSVKLTFSQGSGIYIPYMSAYRALVTKCQAKHGETLLVHGASGAVGTASVQLGKMLGMTVVGSAGSKEGLDLVKSLGADYVVNHREKGYLENIVPIVGRFDIIIENFANINLAADLTIIKKNARIAIIGSRGNVEITPKLLMYTEGSIFGIVLMYATEEEKADTRRAVLNGIESGWLIPVISKEYKPEEASIAHNDIINSTGAKGKLVLVF